MDGVLIESSRNPTTYELTIGTLPMVGTSSDFATTNTSGNATLHLLATPTMGNPNFGDTYSLVATPPAGSPFATFAISTIAVNGPENLIIALQFVHAPPVTTASFSPQAVNGAYTSSPVTVTLSATAASGFTVASTKYTIDNGPEQTYTAPFPISGDGTHTLKYWSVDNIGVFESQKTATLQIQTSNPVPSITSLSPSSAQSGGPAFMLTVNGSGFVPASKVYWNGAERPTTYVSATQLTADIVAADIATPGSPKVTVVSPAPGGGTSNEATFTITQGNRPPTANAGGPYNVPAGASVQLSGSGSDPDGDAVTFVWDLDNNGSFETSGQSPTFSAAGLAAGTSKTVVLQVCDSHNLCTNSAPATINVVSTLQITTASPLQSGTVGQPYSVTLQAAGGQEPYRWTVASGNLPPGLSLNETTGVISGTPTNGGTYGFTIRVTDSSQVATTKSFTLSPPPSSGSSGTPYPPTPVQPTPPAPGDGSPPPACTNYTLAPGSDPLPPGMSLDPVTGLLSGTPTNGGTFRIVVQCTYNSNQTATADFTITINFPVPAITSLDPSSAPAGGPAFTLTVNGTGFVPDSKVHWNGVLRTTTHVSPTRLTLPISAGDIAVAGEPTVTVVNPTPAGGPSNGVKFTITQTNRPPTVDAGGPYAGQEGSSVQITGQATDPDNGDTLTYAWTYTAGPGVDAGTTCTFSDPNKLSTSFTCTDDGAFEVRLTVSDGKPSPVSDTASVTLANVKPDVTITSPPSGSIYQVGASVSFAGTFTDPGKTDTHTAKWSLDGTTVNGTIAANGSVTGSYTFGSAGVYRVKLTVTDDDGGVGEATTVGGIDALVVVFDPNGGFVTGGGWIDSPSGACRLSAACQGAVGKANFGFVSKYQKGATTPSGQTEFQFKAGGLNFHSSSYEWLVVAGPKAQFKGTGTINGSGNYGFMLTATDGQVSGGGGTDKFRIKIWDRNNGDAIVYDNQMGAADGAEPATSLGGGSIVIHQD